ncbi:MAG: CAP domain-containing protein [Actinomycetota bacterium]
MRFDRRPGGKIVSSALVSLMVAILLAPSAASAAPSLDSEEIAFCQQINSYRAANGLPPLKVSSALSSASDWHTGDMAALNYFSHTDSLGRDPFVRMSAFGYNYNTWKGENIAAGNSTGSATFTQWKNSAGHNANMLGGNFKVMGVARAYDSTSTYKWYWNNSFGGFVDAGAFDCGSGTPAPAPAPAQPSASINDRSVTEGSFGYKYLSFTVSLSAAMPSSGSVRFATSNGTASAGSDYFSSNGTINLPAGTTKATLKLIVIGDRVREANETFKVTLSSPANLTVADGLGIGTILNDD